MSRSRSAILTALVSLLSVAVAAADEPRWIGPGPASPDGPCPLFRRTFILREAPRSASLRVVGLGHYVLHCNGRVVGDTILNQAWSQFDKWLCW
ncbi:MAG: alpha-L-rhamnosidase N-terminal domain-containing protein [Planctomycetes bacterium]|nr:alpha-L-rhamnosidase N-terminal domain-containing protein [Planctomycetota bacterium]